LITTEIRKAEQTQFGARNHEGMCNQFIVDYFSIVW
jgi:hypothetical protein